MTSTLGEKHTYAIHSTIMIPKTIHLCWFSGDAYPPLIKACLDSWKHNLPDYTLRIWTYDDAKAIGIPFIDEALANRKWAFAADVVRFYAVWKEGGVYMDSDIIVYQNFAHIFEKGKFVTTHEKLSPDDTEFGLQAAFFGGEAGNEFCSKMVDIYRTLDFNDTLQKMSDKQNYKQIISPYRMLHLAEQYGYVHNDEYQDLGEIIIYPTRFLLPNTNRWKRCADTVGMHQIVGSWKSYAWNKRLEKWVRRSLRAAAYYGKKSLKKNNTKA